MNCAMNQIQNPMNEKQNQSKKGETMEKSKAGTIKSLSLTFLLTFILVVTALWVGSAVAAEKKMVMDPSTGEMVEAPRYGGTFTQVQKCEAPRNADIWFSSVAHTISGVIEKLGIGNWAIPRDEYNFNPGFWIPEFARTGHLAESWEQPDPTTYVLKIRQGVHWHNKAPMNSREFDAYDVEWNYHRYAGLGKFADSGPSPYARKLAGCHWNR